MNEFQKTYGIAGKGLQLLVKEFIVRAPSFKGDTELAGAIGKALAMLATSLDPEGSSKEARYLETVGQDDMIDQEEYDEKNSLSYNEMCVIDDETLFESQEDEILGMKVDLDLNSPFSFDKHINALIDEQSEALANTMIDQNLVANSARDDEHKKKMWRWGI